MQRIKGESQSSDENNINFNIPLLLKNAVPGQEGIMVCSLLGLALGLALGFRFIFSGRR